ncbi:hypothetical protein VZT92_020814 [Zoarces viviparus]|uniref:Uncharacterized protein n=1 Tax=Zoarces viviparus TaxID=48416 RepID=A0AAW1EFV5_ZOAVI
MLRNGTYRSMYQGEESRLRSGSLAVARERKHLALCINNQEEVKRCHRYCNHSGGQAAPKVERSHPRKSEEADDNSPRRREQQQQQLEINAIVIQRAWRASTSRTGSWQGQGKNRGNHRRGETVPSESLRDPVMTTNISPVRPREENPTDSYMVQHGNEAGGERSGHLYAI